MSRAVAVPLLAGGTLFTLAIVAAIVVAALQLQPSVAASEQLMSGGSLAQGRSGTSGDVAAEGATSSTGERSASAGSPETNKANSQLIFVHVIGAVERPGIVQVPSGARVSAVIEAAGGASETAVLAGVNLAREAQDGEQLLVPTAEQVEAGAVDGHIPAKNGPGESKGAPGRGSLGLLDLNRADVAAFETLPRVGPALAARIVEWRDAHGRFTSVDQLLEVSGIGEKTLDGFRTLVTVS